MCVYVCASPPRAWTQTGAQWRASEACSRRTLWCCPSMVVPVWRGVGRPWCWWPESGSWVGSGSGSGREHDPGM